jgi:hypothetical protein
MAREPSKIREERVKALKGKLAPRRDKPGFAANVAMLEEQIANLETATTFRDKESNLFVPIEYVIANPESTEPVEELPE